MRDAADTTSTMGEDDSTGRWRRPLIGLSLAGMVLTSCAVSDRLGDAEEPLQSAANGTYAFTANVGGKKPVPVSRLVSLQAEGVALADVELRAVGGESVPGRLTSDASSWRASQRLEPGTRYVLVAQGQRGSEPVRHVQRFRTVDLTLDQQTFPSVAPLSGETVGVGMPVIVSFDVPVTDRASIERNLRVRSVPAQVGAWHWISDREVHFRPRQYWKPGTKVTVDADINSVPAGGGVFGQESRRTSFTVGDAVIMNVDVARHVMEVRSNGSLLRTIPISAGKPGFTTRSGIKVIIEKFRSKRMDAATTGISESDPEYYNIDNVEYAQRVTYSGEFIHAAPWSVGSQGSANVSHGCVGMSTENAAWLYSVTKRGDVVDVTGSDRAMEFANGYGDWNVSFAQYREGSALR